ncbi:glycosyltransferase [Proteus terrae]|uniref:glycosyltransferase n=1 Tax=Proteus terrae TaxID=1574161 RepID=UPI0021B1C6A1|nr:glycosyltransferase [Proteus terrae]UXA34440.1 glycosyltransferase [Proteus terrae]
MNNFNKISVIMPIHYGTISKKLVNSINSILNQTHLPNELIIVADGEITNENTKIINLLMNKNMDVDIKFLSYDLNQGPGFARHYAIMHAIGYYIAIMDSDDIAIPERLAFQIKFMDSHPDISLVGGYIQESNNIRKVPLSHNEIVARIFEKSPVNNVTAFFKKEDYLICGGYPSIRSSEDYTLWCRFIGNGFKIHNLNKVLVQVDFDDSSIYRRSGLEHFKNDLFTQRELLKYSLVNKKRFYYNLFRYFIFRNLPLFMKKMIYKNILRKTKNKI